MLNLEKIRNWAHGYKKQIGDSQRQSLEGGQNGWRGQQGQTVSYKQIIHGDVMHNTATIVYNILFAIWKLLKV